MRALVNLLLKLVSRLLRRVPALIWRVLDIALNPQAHLRQLGLVIVVQLVSVLLRECRQRIMCGYDEAVRRQERAATADEWLDAQHEIDARSSWSSEQLCERDQEFFAQLQQRKDTYEQLQAESDEYGLMFHLRAELMRRQAGGAGYNRDGSTWLRRHAAARDRIQTYQAAVCNALRYIASGAPHVSPAWLGGPVPTFGALCLVARRRRAWLVTPRPTARLHQRDTACIRPHRAPAVGRSSFWRQAPRRHRRPPPRELAA
ncbi:hypothetical protein OAO87_02835 [bacterium]|nr:hypothetical protein [bacterium]